MNLVSPLLVSDLASLGTRLEMLLAAGQLGPGVLVGHLPVDATQAWPARTPLATFPTTPRMDAEGIAMDMGCWLLRPRHLVGLVTCVLRAGRADNNDVVIAHASVSHLHARILAHGPRITLVDMGSTQGTWIRGERLVPQRKAPLLAGDRLRLGCVELVYLPAERLVAHLRPAPGAPGPRE